MLWYKTWLETRARFLISLVGMTALCGYRVYDLNHMAQPLADISYYYFILHSGQQLLALPWLVAMTFLMMGGLLQEKANGSASFSLALPVSRAHITGVRICAGLMQALLLIVVPWAAMYAAAYFWGPLHSARQVFFYALVLAGGGAVFVGSALLISSLVEATYVAPMLSAGVVLACANAPKSLSFLNPLDFIDGRNYMARGNVLVGPMPWGHAAAYMIVAALLIVASVKVIERRDF